MPTVARRWVAFIAVVAFSLVRPVAIWDRSILSESLGLSLLAGTVAAGLWLLRRPGYGRLAVFLGVAAAWAGTRDTNVDRGGARRRRPRGRLGSRSPPVERRGIAGAGRPIGPAGMASRRRRRARRRAGAVEHGRRPPGPVTSFPCPTCSRCGSCPSRIACCGSPSRACPASALRSRRRTSELDRPVVVPVDLDAPRFESWRAWLETDGRAALLRYAVTHPDFVVSEPLQDPERTFNNGDGDVVSTYAPQGSRGASPGSPPCCGFQRSRRWRSHSVSAPSTPAPRASSRRWRWWPPCASAASAPLAIVAWHADAMETARSSPDGGRAPPPRRGAGRAVGRRGGVGALDGERAEVDAPAPREAVPPGA